MPALLHKHYAVPMTFVLSNGEVLAIGDGDDVPQCVIDKALGRLRAINVMTFATLQAEFPAFEILQAFQPFNLAADNDIVIVGLGFTDRVPADCKRVWNSRRRLDQATWCKT